MREDDLMPQPEGAELDAVRERRAALREEYLRPRADRPASTARGIHHAALICRDVETTIRFYQELLGFPLVELVENRDYAGSSHFDAAGIEYLGPDRGVEDSLYVRDPNGVGIELYRETLGIFEGTTLVT
jgi:glyoxylase I family protein